MAKDTGWLQLLINNPPHFSDCGQVWKRKCPGGAAAFEGGMDLPSSIGQYVYALADGEVIGAGYFTHPNGNDGYGVVTTRVQNPDGTFTDLYYQHIMIADNITLCNQKGGQLYNGIVGPPPTRQQIKKNQVIGMVSAAGEVEVGMNADWGGIWGDSPHPGAWSSDPEDYIRYWMSTGGGTGGAAVPWGNFQLGTFVSISGETVHNATQFPGLFGPISAIDTAEQWHPFQYVNLNTNADIPILGGLKDAAVAPLSLTVALGKFMVANSIAFLIRGILVVIGVILLIALLINATSYVTKDVVDEGAVQAAATAAVV